MKIRLLLIGILLVLALAQPEAVPKDEEEFEQELLYVFKDYDTDSDGVLSKEEMFTTIEEELPDKQSIADALDMLKSLYEVYDTDNNGIDWQEFQKMALIPRTAFTDLPEEAEQLEQTPGSEQAEPPSPQHAESPQTAKEEEQLQL